MMTRRGKVIPLRPSVRRIADDEPGLVEAHRCPQAEALVVRGLLDSEGIPSVLRSRVAHSVHPFTVGDQGEVVILVPEAEAARARQLLARPS